MEINKRAGIQQFLQKTVQDILNVELISSSYQTILTDTLVFALKDDQQLQITVKQGQTLFHILEKEENPIVDFPLDEGESTRTSKVQNIQVKLPATIQSVTGVWAGKSSVQFLVGIILWTPEKQPFLCLCLETDEIEVLTHQELKDRIDHMVSDYGEITMEQFHQLAQNNEDRLD
jgi:hypothetical protein